MGMPSSANVSAHSRACHASSAQCRVSDTTSWPSVAARIALPSSRAPSSSLWRYQLSFQHRFRSSGVMRHFHAVAGETLELVIHGHDRREVVLLGHRNLVENLQADMSEVSRFVDHLFRFGRGALQDRFEEAVGKLAVPDLVLTDQ